MCTCIHKPFYHSPLTSPHFTTLKISCRDQYFLAYRSTRLSSAFRRLFHRCWSRRPRERRLATSFARSPFACWRGSSRGTPRCFGRRVQPFAPSTRLHTCMEKTCFVHFRFSAAYSGTPVLSNRPACVLNLPPPLPDPPPPLARCRALARRPSVRLSFSSASMVAPFSLGCFFPKAVNDGSGIQEGPACPVPRHL